MDKDFELSLDWLTFTYKPENSKVNKERWALELTRSGGNLATDPILDDDGSILDEKFRAKLPIDYFWQEFPNLHFFIMDHAKKMPKGKFNYNSGVFCGSGNGYTDFMILYCMETTTANVDYAFRQGVNVSVPGHYVKTFAEIMGFDTSEKDFISEFFAFLCDHGCHASRIDIAFDDFTKTFSSFQFVKEMVNGNIVSKFQNWECKSSCRSTGSTFYLGDRRKKMIRIYDKWFESRGVIDSVRYEAEFHENYAKLVFNQIADKTFNFNFYSSILCSFFKISELSPIYEEWIQFWSKGQFNEELIEVKPFNSVEQYAYNCKFEETTLNFWATYAEYFGDQFVLEKLHRARDNPLKRNKKLEAFIINMDLNDCRSDFLDHIGCLSYKDVFSKD